MWNLLLSVLLEFPVQHSGCRKVSKINKPAPPSPQSSVRQQRNFNLVFYLYCKPSTHLSGGGAAHSWFSATFWGNQVRPLHWQRYANAVHFLKRNKTTVLKLHTDQGLCLAGGSGSSTTTSACEAAPTFCTNLMENTKQLEKQAGPFSNTSV